MEGSCAMTQSSAACGLSVGDGDTLNVEHELSRWLHELNTSVSRSSSYYMSSVLRTVSL